MNIYKENDYKKILSELVAERKRLNSSINFQQMSQYARIPKSYLSRVIHDKAELNSDQMELICRYLKLTEDEADYLQLLLEESRSSLKVRKEKLKARIQTIQREHLDTQKHLTARAPKVDETQLNEYYLDPLHQIIHVSLAIPQFQKNPEKLCEFLHISVQKLESVLNSLERMGLISRSSSTVELLVDSIHLPKSSTLYRSWRNQLKIMSMSQLDRAPDDETYSFSVVFTGDEKVRKTIQQGFLEYLSVVEKEVSGASQKHTYQMSFDLFPWT